MANEKKLIYADDLFNAIREDVNINGSNLAKVKRHIEAAPAVTLETPCDLCRYNPPSVMGGKPCVFCVAERRAEDGNT